jgi:hypothetical protein
MIHGEKDSNPGTFPLQSERLYQAIAGNGGTVRLGGAAWREPRVRGASESVLAHPGGDDRLVRQVRESPQRGGSLGAGEALGKCADRAVKPVGARARAAPGGPRGADYRFLREKLRLTSLNSTPSTSA